GKIVLELQSHAIAMSPGQRQQGPSVEAVVAGSLDLAANELDRALAVDRQHVVGKSGQIHCRTPFLHRTRQRPSALSTLARAERCIGERGRAWPGGDDRGLSNLT